MRRAGFLTIVLEASSWLSSRVDIFKVFLYIYHPLPRCRMCVMQQPHPFIHLSNHPSSLTVCRDAEMPIWVSGLLMALWLVWLFVLVCVCGTFPQGSWYVFLFFFSALAAHLWCKSDGLQTTHVTQQQHIQTCRHVCMSQCLGMCFFVCAHLACVKCVFKYTLFFGLVCP